MFFKLKYIGLADRNPTVSRLHETITVREKKAHWSEVEAQVRDGETFEAMHFFHADSLPGRIRAVYALMPNEFNGQQSLQLKLQHWEAT